MFVGQVVHYFYGGRCHAAMIIDFWEDQSIARLTVFRDGGPWTVNRAEQAKRYSDDLHFHELTACPNVEPAQSPAKVAAAAPAVEPTPDAPDAPTGDAGASGGEPAPAAEPEAKPKAKPAAKAGGRRKTK